MVGEGKEIIMNISVININFSSSILQIFSQSPTVLLYLPHPLFLFFIQSQSLLHSASIFVITVPYNLFSRIYFLLPIISFTKSIIIMGCRNYCVYLLVNF